MALDVRINQFALDSYMAEQGGDVWRELQRRALRVESLASQLCPVDTGRLSNSITHEMGVDADGPYSDVGTNVEYALFVELGTSRAAAQPYLRPALEAAKSGVFG